MSDLVHDGLEDFGVERLALGLPLLLLQLDQRAAVRFDLNWVLHRSAHHGWLLKHLMRQRLLHY